MEDLSPAEQEWFIYVYCPQSCGVLLQRCCWTVDLHPIFKPLKDSNKFSWRVVSIFDTIRLAFKLRSLTQPLSLMLPPLCFVVGILFSAWWEVCLRQGWSLVSSDHSTSFAVTLPWIQLCAACKWTDPLVSAEQLLLHQDSLWFLHWLMLSLPALWALMDERLLADVLLHNLVSDLCGGFLGLHAASCLWVDFRGVELVLSLMEITADVYYLARVGNLTHLEQQQVDETYETNTSLPLGEINLCIWPQ